MTLSPCRAAAARCLLALSLLPFASVTAAQSAPAGPGGFGEVLEVTVVNVEVVVTDAKGQRVRGLTAGDFELFEDGRPVRITNFYAFDGLEQRHGLAAPVASAAPAPAPGAPAALAPPPAPPAIPEEQRLHLVVYVDNLFLEPFHRNRVVREVRDFLRQALRPGDRVMVVTSERGLHVRQPFTEDAERAAQALLETEGLSAFGEQASTARKELLHRLAGSRQWAEAEPLVSSHVEALHHDVEVSLRKLRELVETLGGLPGRKALLYVSDGLPVNPAEDLFLLLDQRFGGGVSSQLRASRYSVRDQLEALLTHANASRVTFYTIDATGLRSHAGVSAEHGGSYTSYLEADTVRDANRQESLATMALETGGLAAVGTNDVAGALDAMVADFASYYSLGFAPAHAGSGRYYELEVRAKDRRLRVRHRDGYRDHSPATIVRDSTVAALLHGYELNPLEVQVRVAAGARRDDASFQVPVEVRIPLGGLTLVPQADGYHGRLQVAVAAADRAGDLSPVQQTPVPITIPAAQIDEARGQYFVYAVELLLRPGEQWVAVGVRDDLAGDASFVRTPVRVGGS